jgi:hypothetical protein
VRLNASLTNSRFADPSAHMHPRAVVEQGQLATERPAAQPLG